MESKNKLVNKLEGSRRRELEIEALEIIKKLEKCGGLTGEQAAKLWVKYEKLQSDLRSK